MNWEQWYCSSQICTAKSWMVQRDAIARDVWLVAEKEDDYPFTVAATDPVCPRCGATLLGMVELKSRLGEPAGAEGSPIFDFLRNLA